MKKQMACLLAAAMLLGLTACGGGQTESAGDSSGMESSTEEVSASESGETENTDGDDLAERMSSLSGTWKAWLVDLDAGASHGSDDEYDIILHADGTLELWGKEGTWTITEEEDLGVVNEEVPVEEVDLSGSVVLDGTEYGLRIEDTLWGGADRHYYMYILDANTSEEITNDEGYVLQWTADEEDLGQSD